MDNESVKTYTDKESFEKIFNDIFAKFQSFLKTEESSILVKFISYSQGKAAFKIESHEKIADNCIIFSRDDSNNSIYAFFKLINIDKKDIYNFSPIKIQIASVPRKEERKILNYRNNINERLFIINMISEFIIIKNLEFNKNKINHVVDVIKTKLDKTFHKIRVYFIHQGKDNRMEYFKNKITTIFIPNIKLEPPDKCKELFELYTKTIYPNDNYLKYNDKLISEISVPILYNMKIPYGYIQVNNSESFEESSLQMVKKMAVIINELLRKNEIFPQAEEKLAAFDISKNGLSIIFKNKQCIKYFNENQLVYFDLLLPDNKKANILATVKNIIITGSTYKVGCGFKELDALTEIYYYEYLESIGLKIQ